MSTVGKHLANTARPGTASKSNAPKSNECLGDRSVEADEISASYLPNGSSDAVHAAATAEHPLAHLSTEEKKQFWHFGEGPRQSLRHAAIHHAFEQQVLENANSIAVVNQDQTIDYRNLNYQAEQLSIELKKRGVLPGDVVPLFLERSIPMVVGILASLKSGAAYAPQHVGVAPDSQLSHVATELDAKLVLTLAKFKDRMATCTGLPCIAIDEFTLPLKLQHSRDTATKTNRSKTHASLEHKPSDTAMVLFTSGTTGLPNGVKVTHRNLCNILLTSPGNLGIKPGTKVCQILSISFDMAAWEVLGCLCNGGTLLIRGKDIAETARHANVIIATPSVLSRIPHDQCKQIETVAVAGEPCPRYLADKWSEVATFYNSCGPTETTIVNTMLAHKVNAEVLSIGEPTPNNTVYILDQNGVPCHIGETGEMWAGGFAVTAGYLNNPALTQERYRDDPFLGHGARMFNTRDLGRWTKDGTLEHLGRTDDQVKIRGFRVELDSVSAVLEAQANCTRAATLKIDDKTLIAFMSPLGIDADSAKCAVAAALPYYCVPSEIHVLPALPQTSRGKIDKRLLLKAAKFRRQQQSHLTESTGTDSQQHSIVKAPRKQSVNSVDHDKGGAGASGSTQSQQPTTRIDSGAVTRRELRLEKHQRESDARIEAYREVPLPDSPKTLKAKLTHHRYYHYWRLVAAIACINIGVFGYGLLSADWWAGGAIRIDAMLDMAVLNLSIAILFRQQYVVNLLFGLATSVPLSAPIRLRQLMGKVYHFGGIHVGGALFGTIWMCIAVCTMFVVVGAGLSRPNLSAMTMFAATQLVFALVLMLIMAKPAVRQKFHNQFELVHRFAGWFALFMFWSVALSFINDSRADISFANALVHSSVFWALLVVTASIVLPWLRLKRVPVRFERPSDHVVLAHFDYGVTPFAGSSTTISRSPLTEWHSFANVPAPGKSGFRLTISRAGDWTGRLIDDLPSHLWVKGIPTAGVGNVDQLFKRVVWIATGSGIGPTLPHLLAQQVPAHLVWSTRNARKTYGDELVDEIVNVEPNAVIWDTDKLGRPDLVQMAYAAVQEFDAEAVIVIANEKLTRLVVHNMEARGIPAYGAIWDS